MACVCVCVWGGDGWVRREHGGWRYTAILGKCPAVSGVHGVEIKT